MQKKYTVLVDYGLKNKVLIILLLLLLAHIFLRFYLLAQRANLGWDQIDSAWAAKSIIVDKQVLIQGPVAKGNSGFYLGPLYYYLIAIFYFFTNLDPIASPVFAAIMSIFNFLVLFFITKKIFGNYVGLMAIGINTFSLYILNSDRTQSAYYLIPLTSYIIFYFLYKVITGNVRHIFYLAAATGLSFHVDFVSIFYPIIIFLTLPFFPRNKKTVQYILLSLSVFFLFILPMLFADFFASHSMSNSLVNYLHTYYHGFHLTRILQLSYDAFFYFGVVLQFNIFRPFIFIFFPLFGIIFYFTNPKKERLLLLYLMFLWIFIPWLVFSTYRGEITQYYFSQSQDIVIAVFAFLTVFLYKKKFILGKMIVIIFWCFYAIYNLQQFFNIPSGNMLRIETSIKSAVINKEIVPFKDKDPNSYLYYIYKR